MELLKLNEGVIYSSIIQNLKPYPILKTIYDTNTIKKIINNRFRIGRTLLFYLAVNNEYTRNFWNNVSNWICILRQEDSIEKFSSKLIDPKEFLNSMTELEFAGRYKEKGYSVELEPKILDSSKIGDFRLLNPPIFFEIKNISLDQFDFQKKMSDLLTDTFYKIEEPYVIDIHFTELLREKHLGRLKKQILRELEKCSSINLPYKFDVVLQNEMVANIEVIEKSTYDFGYYNAIYHPLIGSHTKEFQAVRGKIKNALKQLPAESPGVIILETNDRIISDFMINNAIYGNETVSFSKNDKESIICFRDKNRIFRPEMNARLSIILSIRRHFGDFNYQIMVHYNPYAKYKFDLEQLKQLFEFDGLNSYLFKP